MEDPRRQSIRRLRRWGPALGVCGLVLALADVDVLRTLGLSLAIFGALLPA